MLTWSTKRFVATVAVFVAVCASTVYLVACPFCSAINLTFTEQIKTNDIVVIAKLLEIPQPVEDPDAEIPKSVFEITDVIKGNDIVRSGMEFRSLLIGRYPIGDEFLVMGVDPPNVAWSTPMKASKRVVGYLQTIQSLPKSGVKRLAFFQQYFEDKESVLAFDAYDEFAQAPYEDVVGLKDQMNRPQLVEWIKDKNTSTNRRRLYLTMLGICGQEADIKMLEGFIKSGDRKQQAGLDALIACYLTLKGEAGLDLIVDSFLKEKNVEYVDTLAAVTAIRFHGTDVDVIPKSKVVAAIRTLLDRPDIADMVIPDLARWEDWSVMDKLVQMFKEADEETSWVRVPIASYLRACPKPEAKDYIAELQKIDPNSIKRADFFLGLGGDDDDWGDGADGAVAEETNDSTKVNDTDKKGVRDKQSETTSADDDTSVTHLTQRIPLAGATSPISIPNPRFMAREANYENTTPVVNEEPNAVAAVEPDSEKSSASPGALVAQTQPTLTTPFASAEVNDAPIWQIVLIPMAFSLGIFVLLWSVISGWFDRLIY